MAYQLHRRSDGTGIVVAFRRPECQDSTTVVRLRGLREGGSYELVNADTGETTVCTGRSLSDGLVLRLGTPRSSLLFRYKEVGQQSSF